jgi:pyruvate/oxaloacetate carboxyltransferase
MRIFDALNDINNMKSTIKFVKQNGGIADCAVCYTVDPNFTYLDKVKGFLKGKKIPKKIFTVDYFVKKAKELEKLGADIISIKDMAGLIPPQVSGDLIKRLKKEVKVPVDLHTHCTPGYGLAAVLKAIISGVDIVDTVILNFAGGPAAPSFELVQLFCNKLNIDTGVNLDAVVKINKELKFIREELAQYDEYKMFPIDFDITKDKLPSEIDKLFNKSIKLAKADKDDELIEATQQIEKYFNFPDPDSIVQTAQIPGGMYTNMMSQLKQAGLQDLLNSVLAVVPKVRLDAGLPPLVTPTSQIVGVQAVYCIIDENKGKPFYDNTSTQFVNLVKGVYGKTPFPVDPEFRLKIAGVKKEMPYDTKQYKKQDNPKLKEFEDVKLAINEKEQLLLELFPAVASGFLKRKREIEYKRMLAEIAATEEADNKRIAEEAEKYNKLSEKEKEDILLEGLYHNW